MRFALDGNHRAFFDKHGYIEFEEMLSLEQVDALKQSIGSVLAKRQAGKLGLEYDLWRDSDTLKKVVHKNAFVLLASELFQVPTIRCGFDAYLSGARGEVGPFPGRLSLEETCCLSPMAGGLLLPLESGNIGVKEFPLPQRAGSGLFVSAACPIPWPELFSLEGLRLLVIGFATSKTLFRAGTRDPYAAHLKLMGYVFNHPLQEATHPVISKKH